ncbi:hypothetical protein MTBBW1_1930010 [Desulfamplus magnetovallimortis]|uniref:Uncharacterized protein n=1 Tax=Desulfamplus magnetovallimortis TaxID=1246637 RepID=A0A1W1HB91_9BACT|nr:hypothetical protein MTBBW1_1930010 [Desulfamplus magnetovallimortis]
MERGIGSVISGETISPSFLKEDIRTQGFKHETVIFNVFSDSDNAVYRETISGWVR